MLEAGGAFCALSNARRRHGRWADARYKKIPPLRLRTAAVEV